MALALLPVVPPPRKARKTAGTRPVKKMDRQCPIAVMRLAIAARYPKCVLQRITDDPAETTGDRGDRGVVAADLTLTPDVFPTNEAALQGGSRLFSVYHTADTLKLWIITEAADDDGKRSATTVLLNSMSVDPFRSGISTDNSRWLALPFGPFSHEAIIPLRPSWSVPWRCRIR